MTDRIDQVLNAIDVGLQTAGDYDYGTAVPEGRCWKCLRRDADPESPSGVCGICRAVLLGDVPEDDALPFPDQWPDPDARWAWPMGPSRSPEFIRLEGGTFDAETCRPAPRCPPDCDVHFHAPAHNDYALFHEAFEGVIQGGAPPRVSVSVTLDPPRVEWGRYTEAIAAIGRSFGMVEATLREVEEAIARAAAALIVPNEPAEARPNRAQRRRPVAANDLTRRHRPCPVHGDTSATGGLCRACSMGRR